MEQLSPNEFENNSNQETQELGRGHREHKRKAYSADEEDQQKQVYLNVHKLYVYEIWYSA